MMFTKKSDLSNTVCGWNKKSGSKNTINQNFQIRELNNIKKHPSKDLIPTSSQSGIRNKMALRAINLNLSNLT